MTATMSEAKTKTKRKQRMRPLPPDVNSRNLAIEKRRRQDMNRVFLEIARCLPKLASSKRLTKNLIVGESLQQLRRQRGMCISAGRELRELLSAHNELITELNILRSQHGVPVSTDLRKPSKAFVELMDIENQPCGEFPDGFGSPCNNTEDQESPMEKLNSVERSPPAMPRAVDLAIDHTVAQDPILELARVADYFPTANWQAQSHTDGHILPSAALHDPDPDCWRFCNFELHLPWEDSSAHMLPLEGLADDFPTGPSMSGFVFPSSQPWTGPGSWSDASR